MRDAGSDFDDYVLARSRSLLRFAVVLTGDYAHAEDLLQRALIRAHPRWSRLTHPDAYIRRSIINDHTSWRRRKSSGEVPTAWPETPATDPTQSVVDRDVIWRALATLSPRQRAVLTLRYYEQLDDVEIADILSCRPATVRGLTARAFAALRRNPALQDESGRPRFDVAQGVT